MMAAHSLLLLLLAMAATTARAQSDNVTLPEPASLAPSPSPSSREPSTLPTREPSTSPTRGPSAQPTSSPTTSSPSASPTRTPTPAPTDCNSACNARFYNPSWEIDRDQGICRRGDELQCRECPAGFFKSEGTSWTTCSPCGTPESFCNAGRQFSRGRGSGLCTYRSALLSQYAAGQLTSEKLRSAEVLAPQGMVPGIYPEEVIRDAQAACGAAELLSDSLTLRIIKPASSVAVADVANTGDLPLLLRAAALPSWVALFDAASGRENSQLTVVVPAKGSATLRFLVKSADIPERSLREGPDFAETGIFIALATLELEAEQLVPNPGRAAQALSASLSVEVTEPSLSLLPTDNSWTLSIGAVERRAMALYNMQVKRIDWVASVEYEDGASHTGWLAVSPGTGSLEQGFECTGDGEVIGTSGVNKAEIVVTVNGTSLPPGSYAAVVRIGQTTNTELFSVASNVRLSVLPGPAAPEETTFEFAAGSASSAATARATGEENDDVVELRLPNTEVHILPRDVFGIETSQFPEGESGRFIVTWSDGVSNNSLTVSRNPVDNSFVGELGIRHKGRYGLSIVAEGSGRHVRGSPATLEVLPRLCLETANAEPHPETGFTCECAAGFGQSARPDAGCEPCAGGTFRSPAMVGVTPFCRSCSLGLFQDEAGAQQCKICPKGHQPSPGQASCSPCPPNQVVDERSPARNCVPCGDAFTVVNHKCVCRPDFFSADDEETCLVCPPGAFCGYGAADTLLPLEGYWRTTWNPLRFEPCPQPEACRGVTSAVADLLRVPDVWAEFVIANGGGGRSAGARLLSNTSSSTGSTLPAAGAMSGCAEGFSGPLCRECAPSYYPVATGGGSCERCDALGRTVGIFLLSVAAGVAALTYLVSKTIQARGAPRRREVMVLKIVLSHLQIVAMTKAFPLEWPPAILALFSVFDVLSSAGSSALSTHCLLQPESAPRAPADFPLSAQAAQAAAQAEEASYADSDWVFLAQSLGYALAPLILAFFFWLLWTRVVPRVRDTSQDSLPARSKVVVSVVVLLIVLQPFLTRAGFEFFSCSDDVDGRSFLEAQFTITCWAGVHNEWIALGALMLTLYAVGIPAVTTVILWLVSKPRNPDSCAGGCLALASPSTEPRPELRVDEDDSEDGAVTIVHGQTDTLERWRPVFGFIYSGYRRETFWWEAAIMVRKGLFATVSVVLRPAGVDVQAYAGLLVLVLSAVAHVHWRPYAAASQLHSIETSSLAICFLTLMGGLLIFSENTSSGFKQACTVTIVLANVAFFLFVVWSIRHGLRESAGLLLDGGRLAAERSKLLPRQVAQLGARGMQRARGAAMSRAGLLSVPTKTPQGPPAPVPQAPSPPLPQRPAACSADARHRRTSSSVAAAQPGDLERVRHPRRASAMPSSLRASEGDTESSDDGAAPPLPPRRRATEEFVSIV